MSELIWLPERSGSGDIGFSDGLLNYFRLVFIRAHFVRVAGSGTDVADFVIGVDAASEEAHNYDLYTITGAGVGADVNFRVMPAEADHWRFKQDDVLRLAWTNPDAGDIVWGVNVGIRDFDARLG